jgi:hypothetical protein
MSPGRARRRASTGRRPAGLHGCPVHRPSPRDHRTHPEHYSVRQGAWDLRKLRGKQLVLKPGRARRYHVPELAARTIAALLTLREKVIARSSPASGHQDGAACPRPWFGPNVDRDYETLRRDLQTLFNGLGITTKATARSTTNCRSRSATLEVGRFGEFPRLGCARSPGPSIVGRAWD